MIDVSFMSVFTHSTQTRHPRLWTICISNQGRRIFGGVSASGVSRHEVSPDRSPVDRPWRVRGVDSRQNRATLGRHTGVAWANQRATNQQPHRTASESSSGPVDRVCPYADEIDRFRSVARRCRAVARLGWELSVHKGISRADESLDCLPEPEAVRLDEGLVKR
jgi:hypothetical protein